MDRKNTGAVFSGIRFYLWQSVDAAGIPDCMHGAVHRRKGQGIGQE